MAEEEMVREGEYRILRNVKLVEPCECDGPGVLGGISIKEDGKAYCTSCGKEMLVERYILFGCEICEPKRFKETDKVEKQFYRQLPKMFDEKPDIKEKNVNGAE